MKQSLLLFTGLLLAGTVWAGTTIDPAHPYAYGANIGWINAGGDLASGAVLGQSFCTGYLWSANCGWIGLGNGPTNGWQYGNAAADDWGVNHDGLGKLSGYAYGANIGWITFEQIHGQPRIDLLTGNLSGYAYGANVGWISLSNAQAFVRTTRLEAGPDTDGDGIPDPWEYKMAGNLTTLQGGGHDEDDDGVPDAGEYPADTDPLDNASMLAITAFQSSPTSNQVTWTIEPSRFYRLEHADAVTNESHWVDSGLGQMTPEAAATMTRSLAGDPTLTSRYFRAKSVVPLSE